MYEEKDYCKVTSSITLLIIVVSLTCTALHGAALQKQKTCTLFCLQVFCPEMIRMYKSATQQEHQI